MADTRRDEKKGQLLNAARAVVARFGYRKSTLEDIAAEAGVSRATLYYYFPNKEEVFRALIVHEIERFQSVLLEAVDPDAPADERLMSFVRARFRHLRELKSLYSVTEHFARDFLPMASEELAGFQEAEKAFLSSLIQQGMESGRFRPVDATLLATALLAALRGLDERIVFEGREAIEEGAECLFQNLFVGLLANGQRAEG